MDLKDSEQRNSPLPSSSLLSLSSTLEEMMTTIEATTPTIPTINKSGKTMKNSRPPLKHQRSFIKTASSPSLSFRLKKTPSINDVLNMDAKLDVYCRNDLERGMLYLVANRVNIMIVFGVLYLLGTLHCYETMSWPENILNIVLFIAQMVNNRKNIDVAMSYGDAFRTLDGDEKMRSAISILIYTTRFLFIPRHKLLFIPITFMWFAGSNKLYNYSTLWGLLPTYMLTFLYMGSIGYLGYFEYMANGYNAKLLDIFIDHFMLMGCVWMFSYYWINVTGFLKHKIDKLQETRQQLENALEARSRFMAHISHEFRCPIMSSLGCLELLKETEMNDKQNDLVDTIVSSNGVLLLLIEDILQIVKLEHDNKEQKKDESNLKTFNLYESLKSMKGIIVGYASNFKVNLNFDIDERIKQMFVRSDSSKIHQILSNLLTNAVKASKQDGEVKLKCEVLEETGEVAKLRFVCQDFGCGIPQHLIPTIFEPFVQLPSSSQSKVPSSGLGLTTVAHMIKSLDGSINVESQVGQGSTFIVDLPFHLVHDDVLIEKAEVEDKRIKLHLNVQKDYLFMMTNFESSEKKVEEEPKPTNKANIIVAEDNPINRKVLIKMINSMGFETDYACDGKELVEKFNPETHKVVITDMNMPQMNGLEAAKELREKYGQGFQIYLLTGNVTISLADLDEIGTIDGVLTKPCSKQDLKRCLVFD